MNEQRKVAYSLLVSQVGWVITNNPDYEYVLAEFNYYKDTGNYYQVTLWSTADEDPIKEYCEDE